MLIFNKAFSWNYKVKKNSHVYSSCLLTEGSLYIRVNKTTVYVYSSRLKWEEGHHRKKTKFIYPLFLNETCCWRIKKFLTFNYIVQKVITTVPNDKSYYGILTDSEINSLDKPIFFRRWMMYSILQGAGQLFTIALVDLTYYQGPNVALIIISTSLLFIVYLFSGVVWVFVSTVTLFRTVNLYVEYHYLLKKYNE